MFSDHATISEAALEERQAREKERNLARARQIRAELAAQRLADDIRALANTAREKYPRCKCRFRGVRTKDQLTAMGCGCTDPAYVCPRLLSVRRGLESRQKGGDTP